MKTVAVLKTAWLTLGILLTIGAFPGTSHALESAQELSAKAQRECDLGRRAQAREVRLAHFQRGQTLAEQAIRLDDRLASGHFALFCTLGEQMRIDGEFLPSLGDYGRMMGALDRTLALDPSHLDALSSKGTILVRLPRLLGGDLDKGEAMLRRVIEADPQTTVNARVTLARACAGRGQHEEALTLATKALQVARETDRQDLIPEAEATLAEVKRAENGHFGALMQLFARP